MEEFFFSEIRTIFSSNTDFLNICAASQNLPECPPGTKKAQKLKKKKNLRRVFGYTQCDNMCVQGLWILGRNFGDLELLAAACTPLVIDVAAGSSCVLTPVVVFAHKANNSNTSRKYDLAVHVVKSNTRNLKKVVTSPLLIERHSVSQRKKHTFFNSHDHRMFLCEMLCSVCFGV